MTFRQFLYRLASFLGDVNAVKRGKVAQRIVRKSAYKSVGRAINRLIK
jgi:hypothetical protein